MIESLIEALSPAWAARRAAARANLERSKLIESKMRGFKAVSKGRRAGDDWTSIGDGSPTESAADLAELRKRAREMARNNPYWKSAKRSIVAHVVGHGIRATAVSQNKRTKERVQKSWDDWAASRMVDAAGKLDWYGIQALVMGTVVSDGECLVLRRQTESGQLKLQVLGAEFLASDKEGQLSNGGEIVGGVETDSFGAAVAYHIYKRHPSRGDGETNRVPAGDVAHVFLVERPNQLRGESWIAPVFTRLHDWDDYEDADLMRQKVSACFGAVYTGIEPDTAGGQTYEPLDRLEPGMVEYMPPGTDLKLISPPASQGMRDAALITHRAIAAGLGITYEALTGDFERVNFSSARMGHLQMLANVREWQQHVIIDMLCDRVWAWFMENSTLRFVDDQGVTSGMAVKWNVPSRALIDPEKETNADIKRVRAGFASWSDVVREQGRDPDQMADAIQEDLKRFDDRGIVLDVDPRKVSAQGQGATNQKEGTSDGSASEQAA